MNKKYKIGIIGLGYVGLPLAIEFSKKYDVVGFDINPERVSQLNKFVDETNEVLIEELKQTLIKNQINISNNFEDISECNIYIITVPTPVDKNKNPDLFFLKEASTNVSSYLKKGDIVIYESTVYPGCTEEVCVPILEKNSGLNYNTDFFCGYSPERINPGDKVNTLTKIKKVTSGSTNEVSKIVDDLYKSIIIAGTYLAPSIKVAEASKAIENAQRDLNISFMNELALIFDKMDLDTNEVLDAASTKWNFLKFKPGLVGGHCISVDPYYLTYKSKLLGYEPKVILSGREVNNKIAEFIGEKTVSLMKNRGINLEKSKILILGLTFKENCSDIRNSQVPLIINYLIQKKIDVSVYDPHADNDQAYKEYNIKLIKKFDKYDGIIIAVAHDQFKKINFNKIKLSVNSVLYDVKALLKKSDSDGRL